MFKKQVLFLSMSLILLLAACEQKPQPAPDNILVPPATDFPALEVPTEQAPTAQAEACPAATADLKLMVNTEDGFCLLYPAEFTILSSRLIALNPNPAPGDIPGDAWLNVEVSDAGGMTAEQIVDAELAALGEGFNITRTELTIDGKPAILVDGLPAFDSARFVYIVNNDRLYRFDFLPWFPQDGATPLEKLYQTVVDTLHFLPTSGAESAPENGCPTETADLKLMVDTKSGFCMLYPAEFTWIWDGSSFVILNPNPAPSDIPGDAWLNVEISEAGGQTAAQIVDAELAALAALGEGSFNITRTELTIDGKPAVLLDGLPAVDMARFVYIVNNDRLYRFDFLPWFPKDGTTPLEKLYQTVVDSLHFLPVKVAPAGCPAETADLKLLVNNEDSYCLLYPAGLGLLPPRLIVINPNNMPGDVPGDAWLDVLVSNALGQTAAQIADAKIAEAGPGFNITRTELTIDGKQAILVDGLPAQDPMRTVFIVHKDMLYRFEFMPWSPKDGTTPLEQLYQTVMNTVHFLP